MSKNTKSKRKKKRGTHSPRSRYRHPQSNFTQIITLPKYDKKALPILEKLIALTRAQEDSFTSLCIAVGLAYIAFSYLKNHAKQPLTLDLLKDKKFDIDPLILELVENYGGQTLLDHLHRIISTYHDYYYFGNLLIYGLTKYLNPWKNTYISTAVPIAILADKLLNIQNDDTILDCCAGVGNFLNYAILDRNRHNLHYAFEISLPVSMITTIRAKVLGTKCHIANGDTIVRLAENPHRKFDKIFADFPFNMPIDPETTELVYKPYLENTATYNSLLSNPADAVLRQHFIESGAIEMIVSLDAPAFRDLSNIPISLLVLSHQNTKVQFANVAQVIQNGQDIKIDPDTIQGARRASLKKHAFSLDANLYRPKSQQTYTLSDFPTSDYLDFLPPKIRTKKIVVIGQKAGHSHDSIIKGAESVGLASDCLELHLEYSDGKKIDFEKYRHNHNYAAIIVGPMPHMGKSVGNYNSVADMLKHEPGFPPVVNLRKFSINSLRSAFAYLFSNNGISTDDDGLIR